MPGENLNSLQFMSSENIATPVGREEVTPSKVNSGKKRFK
jgi:hypothetical protein